MYLYIYALCGIYYLCFFLFRLALDWLHSAVSFHKLSWKPHVLEMEWRGIIFPKPKKARKMENLTFKLGKNFSQVVSLWYLSKKLHVSKMVEIEIRWVVSFCLCMDLSLV